MNDPVACSMCEEAWATTTWGFPVCQPCSDWLDRLHAELQAMPDPGVGPILGGPSASYRERARKAIAERNAASLGVTVVVDCDILYRCADCGADRQPEDVTQDDECGSYHCRTHATECT